MTMAMISPPGGKFPQQNSSAGALDWFRQGSARGGGVSSRKLAYDFFSDERLHIAEDGHRRANMGPTRQGARPPPSWPGGDPPDVFLSLNNSY